MSDYPESAVNCAEFADDLVELALGTSTGRRRSEVFQHVGSCGRCRTELGRLSNAIDLVVQLAPEVEPPLGFETRLAARMDGEVPARPLARTRMHRRWVAALVLAGPLVFGLVFGLATMLGTGGRNSGAWSESARLTSIGSGPSGQVLGTVVVLGGNPGWMEMAVDGGVWSGKVTCEVALAGGSVEQIGRFSLSNGYSTWRVALTVPPSEVRGARLIASDGAVLATASFAT